MNDRVRQNRRSGFRVWEPGFFLAVILLVGVTVGLLSQKSSPDAGSAALPRPGVHASPAPVVRASRLAAGIRGWVSAQKHPVSGARVCAVCPTCDISFSPAGHCATTDARGDFFLSGISPGMFLITASARGYHVGSANSGKPLALSAGEDLDAGRIELAPGEDTLVGVVRDATGGPIAGARVQVARAEYSIRPLLEVLSDDQGQFRVSLRPLGRVAIRADAPGYSPNVIHRTLPSTDATVILSPGGIIEGVVVDATTGKPVEGVHVAAMGTMGATLVPPAASRDDGSFALTDLEPGRYRLTAEGEHHRGAAERAVNVEIGAFVRGVVVSVMRGAAVHGKVLSEVDGEPCREGYVTVGPRSPFSLVSRLGQAEPDAPEKGTVPSVRAQIQHSGDVHLRGLTPGRYFVRLECRDRVFAGGPPILDVTEKDQSVTWNVSTGLSLVVRVQDDRGNPVPHARMSLQFPQTANGPAAYQNLRVDEQGTARLEGGLYPGRYVITPDEAYRAAPVAVELNAREPTKTVRLVLPGTSSLRVTVRTDRGPVDDVAVVARPVPRSADVAGRTQQDGSERQSGDTLGTPEGAGIFVIRPLEEGAYTVEVLDGMNPPHPVIGPSGKVVVLASGQELHLEATLDCSAVLSGVVTDPAGAPLPDAWVSATFRSVRPRDDIRGGAGVGTRPARVMSDSEGNFLIAGLCSDAVYDVRVSHDRGASGELANTAPRSDLKLVARWHGGLEGTIVSSTGQPILDCLVTVRHEPSQRTRGLRVRPKDGQFKLDDLPPGPTSIDVQSGELSGRLEVVIPSGEDLRDVRLTLDRGTAEPAVPRGG